MNYLIMGLLFLTGALFIGFTQFVEHVPSFNHPLMNTLLVIFLGLSIFAFTLHINQRRKGQIGHL